MIDTGEFIDFLKRDKARGNLAPHQIILLISFFNLGRSRLEFSKLTKMFDENWIKYNHLFESKNKNIGLPLKAFHNKELISFEITDPIINFRSKEELTRKLEFVVLSEVLKVFLKKVDLKYLESRINN